MSIAAFPSNISKNPTREESGSMDVRVFDIPFAPTLEHFIAEEVGKGLTAPTRSCLRDHKAKARTPADVRELPNSYVFAVDMPGVKQGDVKVRLEEEKVLVVSGERKREEGEYLSMERRMGTLMRRFKVPGDADVETISAVCRDGVVTVTVDKVPPPKPKMPRTIEVKIG